MSEAAALEVTRMGRNLRGEVAAQLASEWQPGSAPALRAAVRAPAAPSGDPLGMAASGLSPSAAGRLAV